MDEFVFKLPDLGEGVVEGEIVAWHVSVGQVVAEDDPLLDVMTDKATVSISSVVSGAVVSLNGGVGETVAVGSELARINTKAIAKTPSIKIAHGTHSVKKTRTAATKAAESDLVSNRTTACGASLNSGAATSLAPSSAVEALAAKVGSLTSKPLASPAVRRRAREKGLNLRDVRGTGHHGRIIDADLESHQQESKENSSETPPNTETCDTGSHIAKQIESPRKETPDADTSMGKSPIQEAPPESVSDSGSLESGTMEFPLTALRRRIAQKMTVSARHIPHFSYVEQIDITELAELRKFLNERRGAEAPKLTYLPFLMVALARALRAHPHLNAHFDEDRDVVTRYEAVHLGIATQTDRGLYVPVVRNVQDMNLWEARTELRRVISATQNYTIKREELMGSTCTISSLGPYGGIAATPIINHPEIAIIGVNKAEDRPVARDGQIVIRHIVNVSASFDHRVVDGADGIALIQSLKSLLEHPATMFI